MSTTIQSGSIFTVRGQTMKAQNSGNPWSLTESDDGILRFQVTPGDQWGNDPASKNRSEVAVLDRSVGDGTPVRVSYSLSVEPGTTSNAIIGQFHQDENTAGIAPPLAIGLVDDRMSVTIGYIDAAGVQATKSIFTDTTPITRGATYAMAISVTFGTNGGGHLDVTRNGLTIAAYDGPLGWSSAETVYWKQGIYGQTANQTLAVDYSDLAIATGTASGTAATGKGQQYTTYDSAGHKLSAFATDGLGATSTTTYDASGAAAKLVQTAVGGAQTVYDYGVTGKNYTSDRRVYDAAGTLTEFDTFDAAGTRLEADTYAVTGQAFTAARQTYDATGALTTAVLINKDGSTTTDSYTAGALTKALTRAADGSQTVYDYGIKGQAYTSDRRLYNAAGTLVELDTYNAAGTRLEVDTYAVTGQAYTAARQSYDANGTLTAAVFVNKDGSTTSNSYTAGALTQALTRAADGSQTVYDYGIKGQAYTSDRRIYNAAGTLVELDTYNAAGTRLEADTYAVTGHTYTAARQLYDASGMLTAAVFTNKDGSTTTNSYTAGALTKALTRAADGSQTIDDYGIKGQAYTSDRRVYNAAGTLVELDTYNAAGTKLEADTYAVIGQAYTAARQIYDAGGTLTSAVFTNKDGSITSKSYTAGALTQALTRAADGSQTAYDYGIKGQAYTSDKRVYSAAGTLTEFDTYNAAGTRLEADTYAITGHTYTASRQSYDGTGALTTTVFNNKDGSTTTNSYTAGALTKALTRAADGSQTIDDYGITGQSYTSDRRFYNPGGTLTEFDAHRPDGSVQITAYAPGLSVQGSSGNDAFRSAGGNTFIFRGAFGNDTVSNFAAGSGANHDVLRLSKANGMDFLHLAVQQSGGDTVITIDPANTITLQHLTASTLTASNVMFV